MPITAMPIALAAALLLPGPLVAAENGTISPAGLQSAAQTPIVSESKEEEESKAEIQAFENAKVSLSDAISAAEKHTQGKAMDAAFADYNGAPAYQVKTFQHGAVWDGIIDATSGEVIGDGETTSESDLERDDKAELAAFKTASQTLLQALKAAEEHAGGKAIDGGLEEVGGKVVYAVDEFSQLAPPALPVSPDWSPVNEYGGYANPSREPVGALHNFSAVNSASSTKNSHLSVLGDLGFWQLGCDCFAF